MTDRALGLGVDFGTTNSLVSIAFDDRVEIVDLSKYGRGVASSSDYMPSLAYVDRHETERAGVAAIERYAPLAGACTSCQSCERWTLKCDGVSHTLYKPGGSKEEVWDGCADARLTYGVKDCMCVDLDTMVYGCHYSVEDFVAVVLRPLKRAAEYRLGAEVSRAVFGHPVRFAGCADGMDNREARARLLRAGELAGFTEMVLLEEPLAALYEERMGRRAPAPDGPAVAVDFGGGTFDVAVSIGGLDPWEAGTTRGVAVGGASFDASIFQAKMLRHLGLERAAGLTSQVNTPMKMLRSSSDYDILTRASSEGNAQLRALLTGGFAWEFWKVIEQAKIELSKEHEARIRFRREGIDVQETITRSEFDRLIAPQIRAVRETMLEAAEAAEIEPEDVRLVLRTGGAACTPAFLEAVADVFPNAEIEDRETFTTIARGLGQRAREEWGSPEGLAVRGVQIGQSETEATKVAEVVRIGTRDEIVAAPNAAPHEAAGLCDRSRRVLRALADGQIPSAILETHTDWSYDDLFVAAREALELEGQSSDSAVDSDSASRSGGEGADLAPHHGKPWTVAETQELVDLYISGLSLAELAAHFGRSERTIGLRLEGLGHQVQPRE